MHRTPQELTVLARTVKGAGHIHFVPDLEACQQLGDGTISVQSHTKGDFLLLLMGVGDKRR